MDSISFLEPVYWASEPFAFKNVFIFVFTINTDFISGYTLIVKVSNIDSFN